MILPPLVFPNQSIPLIKQKDTLRQGSLTKGGRLSKVDLVQTSLEQLNFMLKILFASF